MSEGQSNELSLPLNIRLQELYGLNEKQAGFLTAFAECGNVSKAAEKTGIARQTHYQYLAHNERYREAYNVARRTVGDLVFEALSESAIEGDKVIHNGQYSIDERTGDYVRRPNTIAQIFLSKAIGGLRDQDSASKTSTQNNVQVVVNLPSQEDKQIVEVQGETIELDERKDSQSGTEWRSREQ